MGPTVSNPRAYSIDALGGAPRRHEAANPGLPQRRYLLAFAIHAFNEIRLECSDCLSKQLAAPSQLIERDVSLVRRWNAQPEYAPLGS